LVLSLLSQVYTRSKIRIENFRNDRVAFACSVFVRKCTLHPRDVATCDRILYYAICSS